MIVLDTNVISELTRLAPERRVLAWLDAQPRALLVTTAISKAEMFAGVAVLPAGKRRDELTVLVAGAFDRELSGRILPFDEAAAEQFAEIIARRRKAGRPIGPMDAQIAAIALACGAGIATRDISDFSGLGIDLVDPWSL